MCLTSYAKHNDGADTFLTHYFPAQYSDQYYRLLRQKALDLTDYETEQYIVESDTVSFNVFQFKRNGKSGYVANKFMLSESDQYSYTDNLDIRYEVDDEVTLYSLFKYENGTIFSSHETTRLAARWITAAALVVGSSLFPSLF